MKKIFLLLISVCIYNIGFAQQVGNGYATQLSANKFNDPLSTGFYTTGGIQSGYPSISWPYPYRFLINVKENNLDACCNKEQFQISTSFTNDDRVFFRKQVNTTFNSTWNEFATRGANTFNGNQKVNGIVYANEVRVETTRWADFVFDADYTLPSLSEVKAHIEEHKHLPGIPSAAEVKENGIGLSEATTLLLKKVEELTLYVIRQNEELEHQKLINSTLINKIELLENKY